MRNDENGFHGANWLGLYIQEGLQGPWDGKRFGIYCLANGTVKGAADFPDLGGGYLGIPSFPKDHRWLKIVRRESRFQAFTSADGKTWQKAMEQILPTCKKDIHAGLLFRSVPGKSRSLFYGSFDNVTLTPDVPQESRQAIRREDLPRFGQVTALVQASTTNTLYARTNGKGLLKSTDGGESWQPANAGLTTPDALVVRSVAVHPKDDSIVLWGSGCVVDGKLKSGLFRSADRGKSWKRVSADIDFDGQGPTTIFGEVIAFNPGNPGVVAAAGETGGLFFSRDAGETWENVGLKRERVTCLSFVPTTQEEGGVLIVGTFDDREFETLGLGKPVSPVKTPGRIYWVGAKAGKPTFRPSLEAEDFGITNIGHDVHENFVTFATTRSVYYTWQHGNVFAQRLYNLPADMLYTALGYRQFMKETRVGESRTKSTTYAAPFSGQEKSPVYCVPERTTGIWSILSGNAQVETQGSTVTLNAGITCILPDKDQENTLYLCNRHGVFKSADKGKSYKLILTRSP